MTGLLRSFWQTLGAIRLVWLIYSCTLVLGLLVALPFYTTLTVEDQNSLSFLNLLNGFDYTVYSDFMHQSQRAVSPLLSVGRLMGVLYIFLNIFFAGGILTHFSNPTTPVRLGAFWQGCTRYMGPFLQLFGMTLLFVLAGAGFWLVVGSLVGVTLSDSFTERGIFWITAVFFLLFVLTLTLILCINEYAKVLMVWEGEHNAFRAFGRAGRLVLRSIPRTYGLYWLLLLVGAGLFGIYFLIDAAILMSNWPSILLMLVVQQSLIFARVGLKVWSLSLAGVVYETLPRPIPASPPVLVSNPIDETGDELNFP